MQISDNTNPKNKNRKRNKQLSKKKINQQVNQLTRLLLKQLEDEKWDNRYASVKLVLRLVGAGAFLATAALAPNALKSFQRFAYNPKSDDTYKRFNLPYLKRTLKRLHQQKLIKYDRSSADGGVRLTVEGKHRLLRDLLDKLEVRKPRVWNGKWTLVTYYIPEKYKGERDALRYYLQNWNFLMIDKSVFLHAYPVRQHLEILRDYLGIHEYMNIFIVTEVENEELLREYFAV